MHRRHTDRVAVAHVGGENTATLRDRMPYPWLTDHSRDAADVVFRLASISSGVRLGLHEWKQRIAFPVVPLVGLRVYRSFAGISLCSASNRRNDSTARVSGDRRPCGRKFPPKVPLGDVWKRR